MDFPVAPPLQTAIAEKNLLELEKLLNKATSEDLTKTHYQFTPLNNANLYHCLAKRSENPELIATTARVVEMVKAAEKRLGLST